MLIKVVEGVITYPYSISQLKEDNPFTSFSTNIPTEVLAEFNVFEVQEVDKPQIEEYQLVVEELPSLENNVWKQVWSIQDMNVDYYKLFKKEKVKEYQSQLFLNGWTHIYSNGETHTLDLRTADDKANWTLLLIKTQGMISAGYGEASVNLRTANNDTITITANEAFQVMTAFLAWGEAMLRRKWDLDTEIGACETLQDIAAIDISSNWP